MTTTPMTHRDVKAEWQNDEHGPAILLTQQGDYSEPNTVLMHPWQLHALCEHFGLVTADPQAERAIATLQRRMLALRNRIDELGQLMTNFGDSDTNSLELNAITMLAGLADEWCADFQDTPTQVSATAAHPAPAAAQPATAQATPTQAPLL